MERLVLMAILGSVLPSGMLFASPRPVQSGSLPGVMKVNRTTTALPALPPLPKGESTIMGGAIRKVDHVLDCFTLNNYGQRPVTVYFDARTQLYRDGVKVPLHNLGPEEHASVQTVLDGRHIFAISIHVLSHAPEGSLKGVVQSYDPGKDELDVNSGLSSKPVKLIVPAGTPIVRIGQSKFTSAHSGTRDLERGTLVSIAFAPDQEGRGVARRISVLAVPGSRFVFGGKVSFLNLASGSLVVIDSQDGKSYHITFDPSQIQSSQHLHIGDKVSVTATYNGIGYTAQSITIN